MKVLITGVAGFLGSRLAHWIVENVPDAEVVGIDDLSLGFPENVPAQCELAHLSLGRPRWYADISPLFRDGIDVVYHMAAHPAEGLSPFIRGRNYRDNLLATAEIVNLCLRHGVGRLVFTSSMAVYGRGKPGRPQAVHDEQQDWYSYGVYADSAEALEPDGKPEPFESWKARLDNQRHGPPFDETDPVAPIDPYGIAKAASERDIQVAGEQHGLDWTIIRPHNVYGPGQSLWNRYRNVLAIWMARRLQGLPLLVYGDGRQVRAFSYIDDCLPCLWRAWTEPAASREIINLGGTEPVTIREAAELVAGVTGQAEIQHVEPRHEVRNAWCTWEKSQRLLGYVDRTPLSTGVAHMWDWAGRAWNRYPERRAAAGPAIELDRGLYEYWR